MPGFLPLSSLLIVASWLAPSLAHAQADDPTEAQVKAAFLYNFAAFTEWPDDGGDTLIVGVVGAPEAAAQVAATIGGRSVSGRIVAVLGVATPAEAERVQILFVTGDAWSEEEFPLGSGGPSRALTVGERAGFAADGGMVNFFLDGGRVRFEVNVSEVEASGIRMSSRLLRLARLVEGAP